MPVNLVHILSVKYSYCHCRCNYFHQYHHLRQNRHMLQIWLTESNAV